MNDSTAAILNRIRPTRDDALSYRVALRLHANADLDAAHEGLDLRSLSRPEMRGLLAEIERSTGIASGTTFDAVLEDE